MELEPVIRERALTQTKLSSSGLRDKYYSELYMDTFEGALYMGNPEYFISQFHKFDRTEIINALEGYKEYFSYDEESEQPMQTVTSTPMQIALFLNQIVQETLPACEESVHYLRKLLTIESENQSLMEVFIVPSGYTIDLYINLGIIYDHQGAEMHYFQEYIDPDDPDGLVRAINNNYEAMHLNDAGFALGYFGE
ncbi:MAG: hypothetical protein ACI9P5_004021 [Saprospiraceae bacterium]|jgi:hypothetical protein